MFLSVFELFKIGIGPSSSHTMGPMTAAADFLDLLRASGARGTAASIRASLHGSLAFTGKGHTTDPRHHKRSQKVRLFWDDHKYRYAGRRDRNYHVQCYPASEF